MSVRSFWRQVFWLTVLGPDRGTGQLSSREVESLEWESIDLAPTTDGLPIGIEELAVITLKCVQCGMRVGLVMPPFTLPVSVRLAHDDLVHRVVIVKADSPNSESRE